MKRSDPPVARRTAHSLRPLCRRGRTAGVLLSLVLFSAGSAGLPSAAEAAASDRVMLLGDSWAILSGPLWTPLFADNGHPEMTVVNPAASGILARYFSENPRVIPDLLAANPHVEWLLLSLGGNDLLTDWQQNDPAGWVERLKVAYRAFLKPIIAERPDLKIVFLGYDFMNFEMSPFCVLMAYDVFRGLLTPQINAEFLRVSEAQRQMAEEFGNVHALLPWGTLQAAGGVPNAPNVLLPSPAPFMNDCIHPTEEGYGILAQAIYEDYFVTALACTTDADGDGFTDKACGGVDCDDVNPGINPARPEITGNGMDDDCNATTPDKPAPVCGAYGSAGSAPGSAAAGVLSLLALILAPASIIPLLKRAC